MKDKLGLILIIVLAIYIFFDAVVIEPSKTQKINEKFAALESQIPEAEEAELAVFMNYMQLYMNKLYFSGQASNFELANFYLHEIEETAEEITEGNITEDGHNISQLTKSMLLPAIETAEKAVKAKDKVALDESYQLLVNSCNACHTVSGHGFIKIKAPENPAYDNQVFTP